jgi:gamma-glutamyltranspeptidase/glutathione hydrolase
VRTFAQCRGPLGGLVLLSAIVGCTAGGGGGSRNAPGYHGAVVADEPHAAQIGREVLDLGGSAGDAAVATYFALSVTLPSSAGLGGGGVCVAYDPDKKRMEVIDFLPRATVGGGMAVPTNVRGMALLHSRFGRQPWGQLLGPAESLARIGTEVSRAFARDLSQPELAGHLDPSVLQIFSGRDGQLVREGEQVKQQDLAGSLARIRAVGAGDFYGGGLARQLAEGARAAGGDLTLDDLRNFVPQRVAPLDVALGNHRLLLPPPPAAGGAVAADLLAMTTAESYRAAGQAHRVHIMAAAVRHAMAAEAQRRAGQAGEIGNASRAKMLMADYRPDDAGPAIPIELPADAAPPATSFVAMDSTRTAVACTVTQGGWFGSGRIATGTGITLAASPARGGVLSMVPLLVVNTNTEKTFLALGSADGRYAAAAAIETTLGLFVENRGLEDMLARPRLADDGQAVLLEPEADDTAEALEHIGYKLEEVPRIGRVNAIYCSPELGVNSKACEARSDPRAFGLAAGAR